MKHSQTALQEARDEELAGLVDEKPKDPTPQQQAFAFLALVAVQGGLVLTFRLSAVGGKYTYNTASAVAITECVKFVMSAFFRYQEARGPNEPMFLLPPRNLILAYAFLALCYAVNNQISFTMLTKLEPGHFVLGKAFAPMFVASAQFVVLDKPLNQLQSISVILMIAGLVSALGSSLDGHNDKAAVGFDAICLLYISCVITATTSVANALLLQGTGTSMHVQNMVLYAFGVLANLLIYQARVMADPGNAMGFFQGMANPRVLLVLVGQSFLGVAITAALKYGGAMVKTMATSAQSALLLLLDWTVFGVPFSLVSFSGVVTVLTTSYMYLTVAGTMPASGQACSMEQLKGVRTVLGMVMTIAMTVSLYKQKQ